MMKSVLLAGGLSLFLLGESACISSQKSTKGMSQDSRTALDWAGTYKGTLPCADCEGIETTVYLDGDLSYQIATRYLGKSKEVNTQKGTFSWSKDGSMITLNRATNSEAAARFKVAEGKLISLDTKGAPITGALADKYILQKEAVVITEKYWKLLSLAGKPVAPPEEGRKEAHFILKTNDNRVQGNGSCNTFSATYKISAGNAISFSPVISTRMACAGKNPEGDFFKALETANHYTLTHEDTLILRRDKEAPLAKFAAVYFQ